MKFGFSFGLGAFVLMAMALVGCSESTGVGPGGAGGEGGSAGSAGMAGNGGTGGSGGVDSQSYGLRFTGVDSEGTVSSLEGVELCQADTDNCDISDVLGVATVEVPVDQEITFTAEKEGYTPWIFADVSDGTTAPVSIRRMYTHEQMTEVTEQQLGGTYPWTAGTVGVVRVPTVSQGGVTFTAVGETANEVGDSFYWDGESGEYGTEHAATGPYSGDGISLPLGDGGFMSVTEGVQTFELGGAGDPCPVSWGWPGDTPSQMRLPVRAGYRTYGSWNCQLL